MTTYVSNSPATITGIGAVSPLGVGADVLWDRLEGGHSGLEDGMGLCRDFDSSAILTKKEARRTHRFVHLAVMATHEAVRQAWGEDLPYPPERISCIMGSAFAGIEVTCDQYSAFRAGGPQSVWTLTIPAAMPNAPPALLAIKLGYRGETYSISSACTSSAHAIGEGLRRLRLGHADAVIVGGTEAGGMEFVSAVFERAGTLSPTGRSRPFDRRRDGFVLAEGAGALVLEDPHKAADRGATGLAYLAGYGGTMDAHHLVQPDPTGGMQARAMTLSLADAGLKPSDIDYVSAHGVSIPLTDRAETLALKAALGPHAYNIPISAPKSGLGHAIGASSAIDAVAAVKALQRGVAPPITTLEDPEDGLNLTFVRDAPTAIGSHSANGRRTALSNSVGFGGHNAAMVITT